MKLSKLSLLIILGFVLLTSCTSDDDSGKVETIDGVWNLKNAMGGLPGVDLDYNEGDVKWEFNLVDKTLTVENKILTNGPKNIYSGIDSGTYPIKIEKDGEKETLFVNDTKRGVLILLDTSLKIDDDFAADGFVRAFDR